MFRIGEFAALTSISIHMLRNYDKIGLLCPEHTDEWTGYRYYSEDQLIRANRIQALKSMGIGLKEIQEMLDQKSFGENYRILLREKIEEKKEEIEKRRQEIVQLELSLEKATSNENYVCDVAVKQLPERNVISYRSKIHTYSEESRLWEYLSKVCEEHNINIITNGFSAAIWHEKNDEKHYSDIEVVFEVEKLRENFEDISFYRLPACEVASIAFRGQYYEIANINYHLGRWITCNNYEIYGNPFCIYYISPGNSKDVNEYLTEISFPIKKKSS